MELEAIELHVMVGVDDLIRPAEGEAVGCDEDRDAIGLEHSGHFGDDAFGVGDMLDRLHRKDRGKARRPEGQLSHVSDDRLAILPGQCTRVDIDANSLARRQ